MPSQERRRTPDRSVNGRPLACARVPGAWLAMQSRAVDNPWITGLGSCGSAAPYRGASRQMRQARSLSPRASSGSLSDLEGKPVMGDEITFRLDLGEAIEHLGAHMRQHDPPGIEAPAIGVDGVEGEMGHGSPGEAIALGNVEIRPLRDLDEGLAPARVARIDEPSLPIVEADSGRGRARGVDDLGRENFKPAEPVRRPARHLGDLEGKAPLVVGRAGEENLEGGAQALRRSDRPENGERLVSPAVELRVEEEEGQAAEMVSVQVAEDDAVEAVRIEPHALQGDERGRAEIERHRRGPRLEPEARVRPAPRAEGVTATDDGQSHGSGTRAAARERSDEPPRRGPRHRRGRVKQMGDEAFARPGMAPVGMAARIARIEPRETGHSVIETLEAVAVRPGPAVAPAVGPRSPAPGVVVADAIVADIPAAFDDR